MLAEGNAVKVVIDQYITPTLNTNLAWIVLELAERRLKGAYHLAGPPGGSRGTSLPLRCPGSQVPGCHWHGSKVVGNETAMLVYFVSRLYCYTDPDEIRRPLNDPAVVAALVNGRKNNRCGIAWDWFASLAH